MRCYNNCIHIFFPSFFFCTIRLGVILLSKISSNLLWPLECTQSFVLRELEASYSILSEDVNAGLSDVKTEFYTSSNSSPAIDEENSVSVAASITRSLLYRYNL